MGGLTTELDLAGLAGLSVGLDEPGFIIGIYRDGVLHSSAAAGLASLEHGVPIGVDTTFDIASVSKQFTACAMLVLADQGVLDPADRLSDHIPELSLRQPVSLSECATHTAGLRDYLGIAYGSGQSWTSIATQPQVVATLARHTELDFPPGTDRAYSNSGYVLLAEAVRRAAARPFAEVVTESIFRPLGMSGSRVRDRLGFVAPHLAACYAAAETGWQREDPYESLVGDGAVLTSIRDLAGWVGFLTGHRVADGPQPSPAVREALLARPPGVAGRVYGMGLTHLRIAGRPAVHHSGRMYHYRSSLLVLPDDGVAVAVLANRPDLPVSRIGRKVLNQIVGPTDGTAPVRTANTAPEIHGEWLDPERDRLLSVTLQDGVTRVDGRTVAYLGDHRWSDEFDEVTVDFDGGELTVLDDIGSPARFRKIEDLAAEPDLSAAAGVYLNSETGIRLSVQRTGEEWTLTFGALDPRTLQAVAVDRGSLILRSGNVVARWTSAEIVDRILVTGHGIRRLAFDRE